MRLIQNDIIKKNSGFTLVELMVALAVASLVILGVSKSYTAINVMVQDSKNLETSQEILRFSAQVFNRSLKQTNELPVLTAGGNVLTVQQEANVLACNGTRPAVSFTESYTLNNQSLTCSLNNGAAITLVNGLNAITFVRNANLVTINITPVNLPQNFAGGSIAIDIALSRIILANSM